ncbi:MAG TPA: metalloregulator ArsR/SmtB family transcription factor [Gemmatimonadales bacterium]|nr:metalloregulator ArsR/SmtB family transcription factor [Gemmatimonadales bacterium]
MTAPAVFERLSALADPIRGRMLLVLERQELTVREIQAALRLPQSTVSRHLKVLADLELVTQRGEGTSNWYRMPARDLSPASRRLWQAVRDEVAGSPAAVRDGERLRQILAERHVTSQQFFASTAGQWDKLRRDLFGERPELQALLGLLDEAWTVGDLGCGTGHLSAALAPFVRRVVAVDESAAMLKTAAQRARDLSNVQLRTGTLEELPVAAGELDAALLVLVLHHTVEPARVLTDARRTLRTGGKLLVVDMLPHDNAEYREQMGHQWLGFTEAQIRGWMEEAGFGGTRFVRLPPEAQAKGPALFAATGIARHMPLSPRRSPLTEPEFRV